MIQRIQTLYLLAASVVLGLCFYFPVFKMVGSADITLCSLVQARSIMGIAASVFGGIALLLAFVAIFMYKRRKKQMLMCKIAGWLSGAMIVALVILYFSMNGAFLGLSYFFPCIAIVFIWLAIKRIVSDEELVRSLDRLR
jgi:hypothetical protein